MITSEGLHIAIVGATGAVGREMLSVLEERHFPVRSLRLLASEKSAGVEIEFGADSITVEALGSDSFKGIDIALFSAGGSVSAAYAHEAAIAGAIVIDNSSHFRMDPSVPLIVPEVNAAALAEYLRARTPGSGGRAAEQRRGPKRKKC